MRASRRGPEVLGVDLRTWLVRFVISLLAILAAAKLINGIHLDDAQGAVLAGVLFGLVNAFIKPVVRRLTCPLYVMTLGLFAIVVNALMLALTAWIAGQISVGFRVDDAPAALLGGLVTGIVSWLASLVL
ncbi:MAG TPA: phage holin family protein [Dehalococcoidia bacterium]|jgi:putative membrane protein|nr:phage holin family protein [Dehalococcoidia bacterium]